MFGWARWCDVGVGVACVDAGVVGCMCPCWVLGGFGGVVLGVGVVCVDVGVVGCMCRCWVFGGLGGLMFGGLG